MKACVNGRLRQRNFIAPREGILTLVVNGLCLMMTWSTPDRGSA